MTSAVSGLATVVGASLDRLGPFEPNPALAVAVSGGADSMALAILTNDWARNCGGSTLALVVDHGLRPAAAEEARITIARLTALGIPAKLLRLSGLNRGSALAERARIMRYEILTYACRQAGILHLLLGHHGADQIETLAMRVLRGSQTHGLAGMSTLLETTNVRLLRPLLGVEPAELRDFLTARGIKWIEDPSNQDMHALRSRLRHRMAEGATELRQAIVAVGRLRLREEIETACELARRTTLRPEGFALLSPGRISSAGLSSLIQTIAGAPYSPSPGQIRELAAQPRPATIAGVRLVPAGKFGKGMLIVREEAAVMERVQARTGTVWDRRFRVIGRQDLPADATIGKLGADAPRFRGSSDLPSVVLRTLPAIRFGNFLAAVPHLRYVSDAGDAGMTVLFTPPRPSSGPCFVPAH